MKTIEVKSLDSNYGINKTIVRFVLIEDLNGFVRETDTFELELTGVYRLESKLLFLKIKEVLEAQGITASYNEIVENFPELHPEFQEIEFPST